MTEAIKVNELAYKTFNYLGVNEKKVEDEKLVEAFKFLDDDFGEEIILKDKSQITTEHTELNSFAVHRDNFVIKEDAPMEFGMIFTGEMDQAHNFKITLEKNAHAKVFLLYDMYNSDLVGNYDIEIGENAKLEFAPLFLKGARTILDIQIHLNGENSQIHMEGGYVVGSHSDMDINMYAEHDHKDTNSLLNMNGILMDGAKKSYKYTIDFPRGSTGSKGIESERTIALTNNFKNTVVPVLLVGEDMIEAEHGAQLTEPDSEKLDYIYSRGIDKKMAEFMVVEAELSQSIDMFNEKGRKYIMERLEDIFLGDK